MTRWERLRDNLPCWLVTDKEVWAELNELLDSGDEMCNAVKEHKYAREGSIDPDRPEDDVLYDTLSEEDEGNLNAHNLTILHEVFSF